jgi:hypothetical protein
MPDLRLIDRSRTATTLRHGSLPIGSISNPRRVVTTRTGAAVTPHEKLSGYALPDVCSPPVAGAGRRCCGTGLFAAGSARAISAGRRCETRIPQCLPALNRFLVGELTSAPPGGNRP